MNISACIECVCVCVCIEKWGRVRASSTTFKNFKLKMKPNINKNPRLKAALWLELFLSFFAAAFSCLYIQQFDEMKASVYTQVCVCTVGRKGWHHLQNRWNSAHTQLAIASATAAFARIRNLMELKQRPHQIKQRRTQANSRIRCMTTSICWKWSRIRAQVEMLLVLTAFTGWGCQKKWHGRRTQSN